MKLIVLALGGPRQKKSYVAVAVSDEHLTRLRGYSETPADMERERRCGRAALKRLWDIRSCPTFREAVYRYYTLYHRGFAADVSVDEGDVPLFEINEEGIITPLPGSFDRGLSPLPPRRRVGPVQDQVAA